MTTPDSIDPQTIVDFITDITNKVTSLSDNSSLYNFTKDSTPSSLSSSDENNVNHQFPVQLEIKPATSENFEIIKQLIREDDEIHYLNPDLASLVKYVESKTIDPITIPFIDKNLANKCFELIITSKPNFEVSFTYENCISHPGNIFVKNLSNELISETTLFEYFNDISKYKSLSKVKLIQQSNGINNNINNYNNNYDSTITTPIDTNDCEVESFAFLNFNNHLDADYIVQNFPIPGEDNPFHLDKEKQLYINKYISKKERKLRQHAKEFEDIDSSLGSFILSDNSVSSTHNSAPNEHDYSTIFIENIGQFIPDRNPSIELLNSFLSKFELFGKITSAYLPLIGTSDSMNHIYKLTNYGYISFEHSDENINPLKALYYLSGKDRESFFKFTDDDIHDIRDDMLSIDESNKDEESSCSIHEDDDELFPTFDDLKKKNKDNSTKLLLSIAQHKHNHHLFQTHPNQYVFTRGVISGDASVEILTHEFYNLILSKFIKKANYQETNIYVNNFPSIFKNNDKLWELFWCQFGSEKLPNRGIKSARIIKPNFYHSGSKSVNSSSTNGNNGNGKKTLEVNDSNSVGKIGFVFYQDFKMALRAVLMTNGKKISKDDEDSKINILTSFAIQKNSHTSATSSYLGQSGVAIGQPNHFYHDKRVSLPSLLPSQDRQLLRVSIPPSPLYPPQYLTRPMNGGSVPEFANYYFGPYFGYGGYPPFLPMQHPGIPVNNPPFDLETSPNDYVEKVEDGFASSRDYTYASSPPQGYPFAPHPNGSAPFPFYLPPATSPIFKDAYMEQSPHMVYGVAHPQMIPIYLMYSPPMLQPYVGDKKKRNKLKEKE